MKKVVDGVIVEMVTEEIDAFKQQQAIDSAQPVDRVEMTPAEKIAAIGLTVDELKSLVAEPQ